MAIFTRFSHMTLAATLLIGSFGIAGNLVSVAIFARREVSFGGGVREEKMILEKEKYKEKKRKKHIQTPSRCFVYASHFEENLFPALNTM